MKMWSMKIMILLLFCYGCLSTNNNRTVYFVSRNFYNILHWDPVKTGQNVTYSVQYWSDADETRWRIKEGCQNITTLSCNLTAETPSVNYVYYRAMVTVKGRLHGMTARFKPIEQTTLGPPILSTTTTASSLHVNVKLPLGPNGVSVADIINSTKKGPSKTIIIYTLKITHPEWAAQVNHTTNGRFIINLKKKQTEYCGSVVYIPFSPHGRPNSEEAFFCVKLPDETGDYITLCVCKGDSMILPWLLTSAALLAAIVIISAVCMCNYVKDGKEKSIPQRLHLTSSSTPPRVLEFPDETLIISKPEICPQTIYAKIQVNNPKMPSVGGQNAGYSPQDIDPQAWPDISGSSMDTGARSATPNPEGTSAQSSDTYAVVVRAPAEEKYFNRDAIEDKGTRNLQLQSSGEGWDKGGMRPNLPTHGIPPLHDPDSCDSNPARPLLLDTVRDANGQLMLPSLTFQFQSSTDDSQRKPLLSDIIDSERDGPSLVSLQSLDGSEWSDSGCDDSTQNTPTQPYCNTHYFPSQQVIPDFHQRCQNSPSSDTTFESGYKQNWMPPVLGNAFIDGCEYRRTDYPWAWTGTKKEEEVEEDKEGQKIPRQINLESWVVQIQE